MFTPWGIPHGVSAKGCSAINRVDTTEEATMAAADLEETTIESFSKQLHGEVLQPGDEGYDEARTVGTR